MNRAHNAIANQLGSVIRTKEARYIRYTDGFEELYDLTLDPNEWNNLSEEAKYEDLKNK
ncbi:MAG: hypothetical protein AAFX87_14745 [Bacteroidota bacterium]